MKSSERRQRGRLFIALLAALGMILAACGEGGTTDTTSASGTTAASETTTTTAASETTTTGSQELRDVQLQLPNSGPSASVVS